MSVSGGVAIGRYALTVGAPAGTVIAPVSSDHAVPGDLTRALETESTEQHPRRPGVVAGEIVASAAEVTDRVEEALDLFKAVSEGLTIDRALTKRIDLLLELSQQLDHDERWDDALRLARALCGLLALAMRWVDLIRSLHIARQAAERLGDLPATAWTLHELGTLHLAAGSPAEADRCLGDAHALRERLGDRAGLAATEANLRVLCQRLRALTREGGLDGRPRRIPLLALVAAALVLLLLGGVAGAALEPDPIDEETRTDGDSAGELVHQLTVHRQSRGTVTSKPAGIRCPPTCDHEFAAGEEVTLTPRGAEGTRFSAWSGDCRGDACQLTMDGARSVLARFVPVPGTAQLSVSREGDGDGRVTGDQAGIDCGDECTASVDVGTTVGLTAEAGEGSTFAGWTVTGCSVADSCDVILDTDRRVVARFDADDAQPEVVTLSVVFEGDGSGTVTIGPGEITCEESCEHEVPVDSEVTLAASPDPNAVFGGWSESSCSSAESCPLTMNVPRSVTVQFVKPVIE